MEHRGRRTCSVRIDGPDTWHTQDLAQEMAWQVVVRENQRAVGDSPPRTEVGWRSGSQFSAAAGIGPPRTRH